MSCGGRSGWQLPLERGQLQQDRSKRTRAASKAACLEDLGGEGAGRREEQQAALDECMARRLQEQEDAALAQHRQPHLSPYASAV